MQGPCNITLDTNIRDAPTSLAVPESSYLRYSFFEAAALIRVSPHANVFTSRETVILEQTPASLRV